MGAAAPGECPPSLLQLFKPSALLLRPLQTLPHALSLLWAPSITFGSFSARGGVRSPWSTALGLLGCVWLCFGPGMRQCPMINQEAGSGGAGSGGAAVGALKQRGQGAPGCSELGPSAAGSSLLSRAGTCPPALVQVSALLIFTVLIYFYLFFCSVVFCVSPGESTNPFRHFKVIHVDQQCHSSNQEAFEHS